MEERLSNIFVVLFSIPIVLIVYLLINNYLGHPLTLAGIRATFSLVMFFSSVLSLLMWLAYLILGWSLPSIIIFQTLLIAFSLSIVSGVTIYYSQTKTYDRNLKQALLGSIVNGILVLITPTFIFLLYLKDIKILEAVRNGPGPSKQQQLITDVTSNLIAGLLTFPASYILQRLLDQWLDGRSK